MPPGPAPVGPNGHSELNLAPQSGETLSYLLGDWRLLQLERGHRWSVDDMVTAMVALQEAEIAATAGARVRRTLDLGCGIGSVLLMVGWGLRRAEMEACRQELLKSGTDKHWSDAELLRDFDVSAFGVEAQEISAALARRSVAYNLGSAAASSMQAWMALLACSSLLCAVCGSCPALSGVDLRCLMLHCTASGLAVSTHTRMSAGAAA